MSSTALPTATSIDPQLPPAPSSPPTSHEKKRKKAPKPGTKAAILLKQQQQQQQQQQHELSKPAYVPPTPILDTSSNVLILSFRTQPSLSTALLRANTAYEGGLLHGPLRGCNFPAGFLPGWAAAEAAAGTLGVEEAQCVDMTTGSAYVVAYVEGDKSTLLHEWAHARYCLCSAYRAACDALWEELDRGTKKVVEGELRLRGYREEMWVDEFQAYVVEGPGDFGKKVEGKLGPAHRALRAAVGWPVAGIC